jgi:hypothetical protein
MPALNFNVKASTSIPSPRPSEFIRIIVVGGTDRDLVTDSPTVAVEFFATREIRAERGAAFARAVLERAARAGSIGGVTCYSVSTFGRPVNLPMESVPDRFRYTFTSSADLRKTSV